MSHVTRHFLVGWHNTRASCVKKLFLVELSQPCSSVVRASAWKAQRCRVWFLAWAHPFCLNMVIHCTRNDHWKGCGEELMTKHACLAAPLPLPQTGQPSSILSSENSTMILLSTWSIFFAGWVKGVILRGGWGRVGGPLGLSKITLNSLNEPSFWNVCWDI